MGRRRGMGGNQAAGSDAAATSGLESESCDERGGARMGSPSVDAASTEYRDSDRSGSDIERRGPTRKDGLDWLM